jgi:P-type Cu2+ transporter
MSCCAPGAEFAAEPLSFSDDELRSGSRVVGEGLWQTDLSVPAIHCGACITTIEKALNAMDGIEAARVNLSTKRLVVRWKDQGQAPAFMARLASLGYPAHLFDYASDDSDKELSVLLRALAIAGFAATNIMLLSVSVWSGANDSTRDLFHWVSALIAIPALVWSGRIFFSSAWGALKQGRTNMDVPISIGVTLAYGMSLYETINHGDHAYFDAAVSLLFFLLIGRTLDHMMRERARSAVKGLVRLSPRGATVEQADGTRAWMPLGEIQPGMKIFLAAGERIPVDGEVTSGVSELDCALVTGESLPQDVKIGSDVRAGTINLIAPLTMVATTKSENSFLAEMIRLMEAAEGGKARNRRIADRAAQLYAPVVHVTAFLSFLGWMYAGAGWHQSITIAVAVLIITCPCALGLAVPIVQVVAARRLFERGIMVKDGSAMERLAEVDTVLFDKTGTLTLGKPRLCNEDTIDPRTLETASALASHSRHPLSAALADFDNGKSGQSAFTDVHERAGLGVEGSNLYGLWRLGRREWALSPCAASLSAYCRAPASSAYPFRTVFVSTSGASRTQSVLSLNGREVATFEFEDRLRADASSSAAALRADGMALEIMSGDGQMVVANTAKSLGISHYKGEMLPAEKLSRINELSSQGAKVLMVGDGLNDAPALTAAHVSMAPATAADIGRNNADFVFLRGSLTAVPIAMEISRKADALIRQNFGIAVIYNALAVPAAIFGYVTPLVAALAMSGSSILVITNAMRLSIKQNKEKNTSQNQYDNSLEFLGEPAE